MAGDSEDRCHCSCHPRLPESDFHGYGFYRAWTGGDLDDDSSFELRESEEGDVIAEGTVGVDGYGSSLVERARFIVETIRAHVRRLDCQVHTAERDDLELLFGRPLEWCPACGARVGPVIRTRAPRRGPGRPPRGVGDQGG